MNFEATGLFIQAVKKHQEGDRPGAIALVERSLALDPRGHNALYLLGVLQGLAGQREASRAALARAGALAPERGIYRYNLGRALALGGRTREAILQYRAATLARPDLVQAHANLGDLLVKDDQLAAGAASFQRAWAIARRDSAPDRRRETFRRTTRSKLRHDLEQLEHLAARGLLPADVADQPAAYRALFDALPPGPGAEAFDLGDAQLDAIEGSYNRAYYVDPGARLEGPAVNPALDGAAIAARYRASGPGICHVDDVLTPEGLAALRRFCMDSAIWYDCGYRGGYLGAYLEDGFACPLLVQLAQELRAALPELLAPHPLRQLWAYKYDSALDGIGVHADSSAVNLNLWLTPDDANEDPARGGLVVSTVEAPQGWDHAAYNASESESRILDYIRSQGGEEVRVPHRQNRVVLFNSDLFHWTDAFRFQPGYESRRLNVTLLYGDRAPA